MKVIKGKHWAKQLFLGFLVSAFAKPRILKIWEQMDINRINREGIVIPCPFCGHSISIHIFRWDIVNQFGLFDGDRSRLRVLYGIDLKNILPKRIISAYTMRALEILAGRSYVDYRRCLACDLVFQNFPHTPASKKFYYQELYRVLDAGHHAEIYGREDPHFVERKELIARYFLDKTKLSPGAKVLDIGCAEGIICRYFANNGIIAFGIEPSLPMVNFARGKLHLDSIICDEYSYNVFPEEFFDGIVTHHVVEHVVDIRGFITAASKHLKSGGYFLLQTPCVDNIRSEDDYKKILLGGHIYGFSERFLRLNFFLGFEILEIKKTPCDLSELHTNEVAPGCEKSIWGDERCGISILAKKPG